MIVIKPSGPHLLILEKAHFLLGVHPQHRRHQQQQHHGAYHHEKGKCTSCLRANLSADLLLMYDNFLFTQWSWPLQRHCDHHHYHHNHLDKMSINDHLILSGLCNDIMIITRKMVIICHKGYLKLIRRCLERCWWCLFWLNLMSVILKRSFNETECGDLVSINE